uniref:Nodule-specific PLAT/LH2 domain protein n=1 Tax=Medicago truncatula f. tricycla TaxID=304102 RepID=A0A976XH98_MEDTR|nr:nodule-specific PLAT/LH2 domain protein [Medicago truncatula f. tricycla]
MKTLTLIFTFSIIVAFSHAAPTLVTLPQPDQMNQSSTLISHTLQQINETRLISSMCKYLITIKTSCNSPAYTTDQISLLFGDDLGSKLYVKRLDDPGAFKKCTTVSFDVMGECTSQICELYLFRKGRDGWKPETVVVYDYNYPPVIFNYNVCLTKGRGIGYNYCGQGSNQISSIPKIKACSLN